MLLGTLGLVDQPMLVFTSGIAGMSAVRLFGGAISRVDNQPGIRVPAEAEAKAYR